MTGTIWIGTGINGVQQLHVANIVNVNMFLQHYNESFPIQLDAQNSGGKGEFANGRLTLQERVSAHLLTTTT